MVSTNHASATGAIIHLTPGHSASVGNISLRRSTIKRLFNSDQLVALVEKNGRDDWKPGLAEAETWLSNPANFALVDGDDLGMFEAKNGWPGPLHAHVLFSSRGKDALRVARAMLEQAFAFGATEILGETPAQFKDAWLFARLLGFKQLAQIKRAKGMVYLSVLHRHNLNNNPLPLGTMA